MTDDELRSSSGRELLIIIAKEVLTHRQRLERLEKRLRVAGGVIGSTIALATMAAPYLGAGFQALIRSLG